MKIYLICQKSEFNQEELERIKKIAPTIWIDSDVVELKDLSVLSDDEPKIVAMSPVPFGWTISESFYDLLKNVKYVCVPTTSTNFIDIQKLKSLGIILTNVPHYVTQSVAEQAIFMMLALLRRLPAQMKQDFKYEFNQSVVADEWKGKTVGVIGLGDIGRRIAEICQSLGMKVVYWSRNKKAGFDYMDLETLMATADIIFPTVASTPETKGWLGKKMLEKMKSTAYFVSVIDQEIWDKSYLLSRAENGTLGGVAYESDGAEVAQNEGNVLVLPSFGWYSEQSLENNIKVWAETILACIGGKPINLV